MIPTISLEAFERATYAQQWEQAGVGLVHLLRALRAGGVFSGYEPSPEQDRRLYTRAAAAVLALLASPHFRLSDDGFAALAAEHATLDALLRCSGFLDGDHLLALSLQPAKPGEPLRLGSGEALAKALAAHSLRSGFSLRTRDTFARAAPALLPLWAGMLATMQCAAPAAHARREDLVGCHDLFAGIAPPQAAWPALADAYMYLSYCSRPDKHQAKATIHGMFARALVQARMPIPSTDALAARRRKRRERPVIVVALEWWTSVHAMFRCYAPIIRELRERFTLVGAGRERDSDVGARAEFDRWITVDDEPQLGPLIERINREAPDAILYPSLGMSMWWIALASVRLAPVQMMMLGHPASSHSPCIDAIVCEEGSIGPGAPVTERVVTWPAGQGRFLPRDDSGVMPQRPGDGIVRVAVPAMLAKLGAPFMAALRRIAETTPLRVEWRLFPNMVALAHRCAEQELTEALPGAVVYPRSSFSEYLQRLGECDLAIVPYPFGGTNSTIDCLRLGVPVLTLEGEEPHARFDALLLRRIGWPEDCIARSEEEFAGLAVRLIESQEERDALRRHALTSDLNAAFFRPADPARRRVVDAVQEALDLGPQS